MSKERIHEIVELTRAGWRPYNGTPDSAVYVRLGCQHWLKGGQRKPFWFCRGDVYCCIGCADHCTLKRPSGFPEQLQIRYPAYNSETPYMLTPAEMMERNQLLNVKQAAYCLNVSVRTIYDYIAEGKLIRLKENPVRVRSKEVRELCADFDE